MTWGPVERAHDDVQRAVVLIENASGQHDLDRCARAVERTLRRLYDACDGRDDAVAALIDVAEALDEALGNTPELLGDLRKLLGRARETLRETPIAAKPVAASPITASGGLPRLHAIERPSLTPSLRAAPLPSGVELSFKPLEPPTTFEELDDFGERQRAHIEAHLERVFAEKGAERPPRRERGGEARFVAQWARTCFEEIAMLASQRRPLRGDDWRTTAEIEARMLASLDAFASLGTAAVGEVERFVLDAPAPDEARAHALAFICGSLSGRDALGMVERIARAHARDSKALDCIAAGLRHAPHPDLSAFLHGLLEDDDPAFRALSARVLASRNLLAADRLEALAADRAEVACHALVPMATSAHPALDALVSRALEAPQAAFRERGWIALALRAPREAAASLRKAIDDEAHGDRAATMLAAIGTRADAEAVAERALRRPTPHSLEAAGMTGHVPTVPRLLELLRHDDFEIALAAAGALERVTGAGLFASVELPVEAVDDLELPDPSTGGFVPVPLGRAVSDARDAPPEGSPDRIELADPSHARWSRYWRDNHARFEPDIRYRAGQPFAAQVVADELSGPRLDYHARRAAGIELSCLTRRDVGFDVDAFVSAQIEALEAWSGEVRRQSARGRWAQ